MVGATGIGGVPDITTTEQRQPRVKRTECASSATQDSVAISPEAQHAAKTAQWATMAAQESDLEEQRIAEARARLEEGIHRMNRVVREVAARVCKYISVG